MSQITVEQFKECIPKSLHKNVTAEFVDSLNTVAVDAEAARQFRDNLVQYADVLNDGRYKLLDYVNASLFVAFKMMGKTNLEAWSLTFPSKYQKKVAAGTSDKDLHSYSSMYNKGKLVQAVTERSMAVDHVLFADVRHKAIKRQAELMMSDNEHVAQKAADSLMNHLKAPETAKVDIKVSSDSGVLSGLQDTLLKLAEQQKAMIESKAMSAKTIAHQPILIEAEEDE